MEMQELYIFFYELKLHIEVYLKLPKNPPSQRLCKVKNVKAGPLSLKLRKTRTK